MWRRYFRNSINQLTSAVQWMHRLFRHDNGLHSCFPFVGPPYQSVKRPLLRRPRTQGRRSSQAYALACFLFPGCIVEPRVPCLTRMLRGIASRIRLDGMWPTKPMARLLRRAMTKSTKHFGLQNLYTTRLIVVRLLVDTCTGTGG
ncbi:hypothetical protein LY76DRAFT_293716 [Colletotrichum caudatum]|nr:hypothetical protein LY76DRAFT_293716 [Colletotrichum caudatum]